MDVNGKRRIRGAVFDLDGTLLDSLSVWETLAEDYLRSLGKEPREDLNRKFAAFTLEEAAAYYQAHYGVALSKEEIIAGINGRVRAFYNARRADAARRESEELFALECRRYKGGRQ